MRHPIHLSVVLTAATTLAVCTADLSAQAESSSLYQRLGGYDQIAAVVDDFMGRFDADSELMPFLGGINTAQGERIRQHFVDFMCARTGGPCLYLGQDMQRAHHGLCNHCCAL